VARGVRFGQIEETVPAETILKHLGSAPIATLVLLRLLRRGSAGFLYGERARPRPLATIAAALGLERSTLARHLRELSALGYVKAHGHGAAGCRLELLDPPPRSKEEIEGLCASLAHERKARRLARRPRAERPTLEAPDQGADVAAESPGVVARAGRITARSRGAGAPETQRRCDDSMSAGATTRPPAYTDARAENLYPKNQNPETEPTTTNPRAELETGAGERPAGRAGGGGLSPAAGNLGEGIGRVMAQAAAARKATAGKEGADGPSLEAQTIGQGGASPTKPNEIRHPGTFDRGPSATGRNEPQRPKSLNPQGDTPATPPDFAAEAALRAQLDGLEDRARTIAERHVQARRAWAIEHPEPVIPGRVCAAERYVRVVRKSGLPWEAADELLALLAFTNPAELSPQAVETTLPDKIAWIDIRRTVETEPRALAGRFLGAACAAAGCDPEAIQARRRDYGRELIEAQESRGAWERDRAAAFAVIEAPDVAALEEIAGERAVLWAQLEAIGRERGRVRAEAAAVEAAQREREAAERAVAAIPGLTQARDAELRAGKFSPDVVAQAALEAAVSIAWKAARGEPVLNVRGYLKRTCVRLQAEGLPVGAGAPSILPGNLKSAAPAYLEQYNRRRPPHRRSAADADYFSQFEPVAAGSAH
jgi:DNA-binding MarR family transcriptional regulator